MATNLVSEIADVLSPSVVSRIASALGLNQTSTQKAVVAAVPALLAELISFVSRPQAATKLNDVVRKQEPGVLASLTSAIGEPGQNAPGWSGFQLAYVASRRQDMSALTGAV